MSTKKSDLIENSVNTFNKQVSFETLHLICKMTWFHNNIGSRLFLKQTKQMAALEVAQPEII